MEYHEIEFEFEGLQGTVVGNTVFYGGDEFSRRMQRIGLTTR
jgi:hypothetical protein